MSSGPVTPCLALGGLLLVAPAASSQLDTLTGHYADGTAAYRSWVDTNPLMWFVPGQQLVPEGTSIAHRLEVVVGTGTPASSPPAPSGGWVVSLWSEQQGFASPGICGDVFNMNVPVPDTGASDPPLGTNVLGGSNFLIGFDLPDVPLVAGDDVWCVVVSLDGSSRVVESTYDGEPAWQYVDFLGFPTFESLAEDDDTQHDGVLAMRLDATVLHVPWFDLGGGVAGTGGAVPVLHGVGDLVGGDEFELRLDDARPDSVLTLVLGLDELSAPFKGGVLVPRPDLIAPLGVTPASGSGTVWQTTWPTGVPAGASVWMQVWVADPDAPAGFAASNGLQATAP